MKPLLRPAHTAASKAPLPHVVFELPDLDSDDDASPRTRPAPRPVKRFPTTDSDDDSAPTPAATSSTSETPRRKRTPKTPSKKALREQEQARREAFARDLFHELNRTVFRGGLPDDTALVWNKRLLTTAGRASYKK